MPKPKKSKEQQEIELLRGAIQEAFEFLTSTAKVTPSQRIENARLTLGEVLGRR